ncbi:MAG: AgmX/PglI C-terminal domain-containing protein [Pseudomonadota bacterium]
MSSADATMELRLPWETRDADERRFRRILVVALLGFACIAVTVPLLPVTDLGLEEEQEAPPTLARIRLEERELPVRAVEPEPMPEPEPLPEPQPQPVEVKPAETPPPEPKVRPERVEQVARARAEAAKSGVLAFADQLQTMRDTVDADALDQSGTSRGQARAERVERALITATAATSSGGIASAAVSRDTGGPALSARETTVVASGLSATNERTRTSGSEESGSRGRSDESIRRIMDENKGAIFAIYNRALRRDPLLEGKLVFEMVINAKGNVDELKLVSSDLTDDTLTRKILSRIRVIQFGAEEVTATRVNYSFDFLPFT